MDLKEVFMQYSAGILPGAVVVSMTGVVGCYGRQKRGSQVEQQSRASSGSCLFGFAR
jgi:hypothetical protein